MKRAIVFVILLWVLAVTLNACASTGQDAVKVAWYLKGEGDLVMPQLGLVITGLKCAPAAGKAVSCHLQLVTPAKQSLCSSGKFSLKGYAVSGQWAKPKPCAPSS